MMPYHTACRGSNSNWRDRWTKYKSSSRTIRCHRWRGLRSRIFLTVADLKRSAEFYKTVFDGEIVSMGDGDAPPYVKIANTWLILNVGGGPTPDKPTVTLSPPPDPNHLSSFMNIRVADIQACYKLWKSRGATFLSEPLDKYGETRCYIRDPDGYIIEVGQSKPGFKYG